MRIIGKSHDYYDIGIGHGIDRDLVWKRDRFDDAEVIERFFVVNVVPEFGSTTKRWTWERERFDKDIPSVIPAIVYLAGTFHHGLKGTLDGVTEYIWTVEHAKEYMAKHKIGRVKKWLDIQNTTIEQYLTPRKPTASDLDWLTEHRIAVMISNVDPDYRKRAFRWHTNCSGLKEMNFAKVVDPYSAFQELSMYIGGVLPRAGNPIVEIEADSTKLKKHGFDQWTFRKQKG